MPRSEPDPPRRSGLPANRPATARKRRAAGRRRPLLLRRRRARRVNISFDHARRDRGGPRHDGKRAMRASAAMTLGPAQASKGTAKGTATAILRSVCGPNPHEQPRTRANSVPPAQQFSGVFARARCCSRFSNQSGRQDLNLRPPGPQPGALPDCATPRGRSILGTVARRGRPVSVRTCVRDGLSLRSAANLWTLPPALACLGLCLAPARSGSAGQLLPHVQSRV
jgi:hypothetical protein